MIYQRFIWSGTPETRKQYPEMYEVAVGGYGDTCIHFRGAVHVSKDGLEDKAGYEFQVLHGQSLEHRFRTLATKCMTFSLLDSTCARGPQKNSYSTGLLRGTGL
ncbi:hypothetical protein A6R68_13020 [Neotoma lepida]|uniref:Uncharacterized protein n=1 Tax=Neotoma lepida TaxID=56216 RepID=A0A1A6H1E2_NEOLE|nr:hypothetical protein A6R68_13020 [Neotoma lepida]